MIELRVLGAADDLLTLSESLRRQPVLRGTQLRRVDKAADSTAMGPLAEALVWAAQNKELATAFLGAVGVWLAQRKTKIKVRIGEREIEVDSSRIRDPDALTRELLRALSDGESDDAPSIEAAVRPVRDTRDEEAAAHQ